MDRHTLLLGSLAWIQPEEGGGSVLGKARQRRVRALHWYALAFCKCLSPPFLYFIVALRQERKVTKFKQGRFLIGSKQSTKNKFSLGLLILTRAFLLSGENI